MAKPLGIAIAGLGTVGAGVVRLLAEHGQLLEQRCGRPIKLLAVSARDKARQRDIDLSGVAWRDDPMALVDEPGVDVVVELIGGSDGVAKRLVEGAIGAGKAVVTANKALLAHHGTSIALAAEKANVALGYEASVAGGIPIIKALREGLVGNRITRLYGILNGTCNYILSTMRESGRDFADVLAEAQAHGYAEADPSFDVDGVDAAHKLAILTSVAFGSPVNFAGVHVEGIRQISALDIEFAGELGYRIKLLGLARRTEHGIEQRVHPCMVPLDAPIAHVEGVFNAIVAEGDFVGKTLFQGRGAGAGPTASAVAADLADIARGVRLPVFSVPAAALSREGAAPMQRHVGAYYVSLKVRDRPGVIAAVAAALRDEQVSMQSMIQRGRSPDQGSVSVVLTTHETQEAGMMQAIRQIAELDAVVEPPCVIRVEQI
jgi:homoserine dehydrogenase